MEQGMDPAPVASTSKAPPKKEKRKLACAACRARRIRCEWPDSGTGCTACELADLRCPGEPEPRKRQKKSDGTAAPVSAGQLGVLGPLGGKTTGEEDGPRLELGGALTFHLIESLFIMANPAIPGAPYNLYREILNSAGGSSQEMEVAAECLCSAFIASAATFSDHSSIVGLGEIEMPTDLPGGTTMTYHELVGYGERRQGAVKNLRERAVELYEECKIQDRPSVEALYTLIAMDQMVTLTTEGGRNSRTYIDTAIVQFKVLLDNVQKLSEEHVKALRGPLGTMFLKMDAETAAVLKQPCAFSELDLKIYFPSLELDALGVPQFDAVLLRDHELGWTNLGTQLQPMTLALCSLYRTFIATSEAPVPSADIQHLWRGVTHALQQLDTADDHIRTLEDLDTKEATDQRQFDLLGLTNTYRRVALRLDLLIHERILEAVQLAGVDNSNLILSYETSIQRVKRDFQIVATIAQHNVETRSLLYVRRLFEMLEVCTAWTSLRLPSTDPTSASILIDELGISSVNVSSLKNALDLASWSSPIAAKQKKGLEAGLHAATNVNVLPVPPPPPLVVPSPPAQMFGKYLPGQPFDQQFNFLQQAPPAQLYSNIPVQSFSTAPPQSFDGNPAPWSAPQDAFMSSSSFAPQSSSFAPQSFNPQPFSPQPAAFGPPPTSSFNAHPPSSSSFNPYPSFGRQPPQPSFRQTPSQNPFDRQISSPQGFGVDGLDSSMLADDGTEPLDPETLAFLAGLEPDGGASIGEGGMNYDYGMDFSGAGFGQPFPQTAPGHAAQNPAEATQWWTG